MDQQGDSGFKPTIYNGDLAKLPAALKALRDGPQWLTWKLIWQGKRWSKVPYRCDDPERHASSTDSNTWSTYKDAVAAVKAGAGDGISYVLTDKDPFGAVDIDHVRDPRTGAIEGWAQRLLNQAAHSYAEVSPSGMGLRIWGKAAGEKLHRQFNFDGCALELFRRTNKILTVTGLQLGASTALGNIDALLDRACVWAERHKQKLKKAKPGLNLGAGTLAQYSIKEIDYIVENGAPDGANRSDLFHSIVGHYRGCGWTVDQIVALLERYPDGIGGRYIAEGRLPGEVERSAAAFGIQDDPLSGMAWSGGFRPKAKPASPDPTPDPDPTPEEDDGPLEEDDGPELPQMFCHGDPDPRPLRPWAIKGLMPACGHGLLSGQWGTGKTFMAVEISGSLMTGQPFLGRMIKKQGGVLFLAAEGQYEVRPRLDAMVREKCGAMARAPFRWFEDVPVLLKPDGFETLVAMGKMAAASIQDEFNLPLSLIIIDTVAASAGYTGLGAENDASVNQQLMTVLKLTAQKLGCFVLGVDHFGKDVSLGTRGNSAKEGSGDLVLACLGERETSGRVLNTRLAIRKCRGGRQGQEYPFELREVEMGLDEDGEPITTQVVNWGAREQQTPSIKDLWEESKRTETRQAMLRLKRVIMSKLAESGRELKTNPPVRGIDCEIVREEFYATTPVDAVSERQRNDARYRQFKRAIDRACEKQLIGCREIDGKTYLHLLLQQPDEDDDDF